MERRVRRCAIGGSRALKKPDMTGRLDKCLNLLGLSLGKKRQIFIPSLSIQASSSVDLSANRLRKPKIHDLVTTATDLTLRPHRALMHHPAPA